jgi:UDP-GlcNAc:undecaprenyl-phosphate GlcNAc-1-phosphate transferase
MIPYLHYWLRAYIAVGLTAFIAAVILVPITIVILKRLGSVDHVSPAKIHDRPVVRGGGIAIFAAFAIAVLWPDYRSTPFNGVMIGAFICLVLGALDDLRGGIPAVVKLGTLFAATLVLSNFGVRLNLFQWPPLDIALTMIWIAGVISAFNGIDNMDGQASGVAVIISAMFFIIALQGFFLAGGETSLSWFGMMAAALVGANLGFLIYNWSPAKIFMGDSGSFFLGFMIGALSVMGEWAESKIIAITIPILILGVPLFDFAYIIIARILRGETRTLRQVIEHCGTDHLSHRLVWIGLSRKQAVLFIYLMCLALGASGILLRNSTGLFDSLVGLLQGAAFLASIVILMAAAERRDKPRPESHGKITHDKPKDPIPERRADWKQDDA